MVRTRFAPSPTGFLHIGGVRTALFNWLYARQHGGQFILRIDDTDVGRNQPEALAPILAGFRWLGIDWDEGAEVGGPHGPYYQSQRLDRYTDAVKRLLASGHAYWDYSTTEERTAESAPVYSRRWMAKDDADRKRYEAEGRTGVVRLKMPREGACEFKDHIRGHMRVEWVQEQDHVIQRADGTCLYNLASVVDDFDMQITHVIRAEEHLSNTPRQIFILEALGYPRPEYAHLPFVAEPGSKNKLSKRKLDKYMKNADFKQAHEHAQGIADGIRLKTDNECFNPVIIDFYEQVGYLPAAILNYLMLVGWSLDGSTEDFTVAQMIEHFSLERVNTSPASFDVKKLRSVQERYALRLTTDEKMAWVRPFLDKAGLKADDDTLRQVIELAAHRLVVAGDILDYAYVFVADDKLPMDEKAVEKHLKKPPLAKQWLSTLAEQFAALPAFDAPTLETTIKQYAELGGHKLGDVSQALRVATTGKAAGFGTFDTLALLGRERTLSRINRALATMA
ncbi:MAG: glutamate--tRNA ligase [Gemmataceae bacterium]|nr:glutamate--tRNA ligase [Gemmataceae bacterium]